MFSFVKKTLWLQFMLWMSSVLLIVIVVIIYFNIVSQQNFNQRQVEHQGIVLARAIEGGMFDALAIGDNDIVRDQFKRLSKNISGLNVFVYDFNKKISFTTDEAYVSQNIESFIGSEASAEVESMISSGKNTNKVFHTQFNGEPFSIINILIPNESRCYHCHGKSRDILGGICIASSEKETLAAIKSSRNTSIFIGLTGVLLIIPMIWLLFHKLVNVNILRVFEVIKKMDEGDFTIKLDVKGEHEISQMLRSINILNKDFRHIIGNVIQSCVELALFSTQLTATSEKLLLGASKTSNNSATASVASEEMSTNFNFIAASMEETSSNVAVMASASEEMSSSINEVAKNAGSAKSVLDQAVKEFENLADIVNDLGKASHEIDEVTDEIRAISEEVSLLALNAKIEAARAGKAGGGFAVVAQEITELASQSSKSTIKVDKKLQWMKAKADETASEINKIAKIINKSDSEITSIAIQVVDQSSTIQEVANNINQISQGISAVNKNVTQGALVAKNVAKDIALIDQAATDMENNTNEVDKNATKLNKMAENLKSLMGRFKVSV